MARKLTVLEQKQMLAERLAKSGSGSKCPTAQIGGDDSPHPKKRATGIVIHKPQQVVQASCPADQRCTRRHKRDAPHPTGETQPAAPPAVQVAPPAASEVSEAPLVGSSAARDVSLRVEEIGENSRNLNDRSYLGWDPRWAAA